MNPIFGSIPGITLWMLYDEESGIGVEVVCLSRQYNPFPN